MNYTAKGITQNGLEVVAAVRPEAVNTATFGHGYYVTAAGAYFDAGLLGGAPSQSWANKHLADALTYLNSLATENSGA